jgi:hypothetical protein
MQKTAYFCPFTAHFGGFEGVFSYTNNKSAILCPGKTETADFCIVQGFNRSRNEFTKKYCFMSEKVIYY